MIIYFLLVFITNEFLFLLYLLIKRTDANKQNLKGGYLSGMFQSLAAMLQS